eukprot:CAMPEP_0197037754 /NCGR_PEP_ID=MMETSP1384-20130603/14878_1 /TAXON_ID=29189 /ORGANISM="Ammonia sp." /LENGTH=598 /DNA_ID=CAMNT_0042468101 /DNA_START=47 /DNA_END=1843 /DNA_ORIENTATION=+
MTNMDTELQSLKQHMEATISEEPAQPQTSEDERVMETLLDDELKQQSAQPPDEDEENNQEEEPEQNNNTESHAANHVYNNVNHEAQQNVPIKETDQDDSFSKSLSEDEEPQLQDQQTINETAHSIISPVDTLLSSAKHLANEQQTPQGAIDVYEHEEHDEETDEQALHCVCGDLMKRIYTTQLKGFDAEDIDFWCYCCEFTLHAGMSIDYFYICTRDDEANPHKQGYSLCQTCHSRIRSFNKFPVKSMHQAQNLYYVYNKDKINGPFTLDQIKSNYVSRQFDTHYMYIMRANEREQWTKLEFPQNIFTELDEYDERRFSLIEESADLNRKLKERYPEIYYALIEDVLCGKLRMVEVPATTPIDVESTLTPWWKKLVTAVGKLLATLIVIVLFLHALPTAIVGLIFGAILYCMVICKIPIGEKTSARFLIFIFAVSYSGIILWPILDTFVFDIDATEFVARRAPIIDPVAYLVWGVSSYTISIVYVATAYLQSGYQTMTQFVLSMIFFDFKDYDLSHTIADLDWSPFIATMFVFPSLLSLLPAAICGFIVSFDGRHENAHAFIGGLAGYVLTTCVLIRCVAYFLLNAFPQLQQIYNRTH